MTETRLAMLEKNPGERIYLTRREYKGFEFIDLRVFYQDDAGQWQPTKRGLTVSLDLWPDFKAAIAGVTLEDTPAPRPRRQQARH